MDVLTSFEVAKYHKKGLIGHAKKRERLDGSDDDGDDVKDEDMDSIGT